MSNAVAGTITSGAGKVGRYFTVVSALPAAVFVSYVYVIVQATWSDQVNWSALTDAPWYGIPLAALAALVLALTMNPLQFALIQLFEGYWGTSPLGVRLATIRVLHHRRRKLVLESTPTPRPPSRQELELRNIKPDAIAAMILHAERERALSSYPALPEILPTRLGNVLRHYERKIGFPYGLEPISAVPRLAAVAGERELASMRDHRVQLELAIRTSFMAFLATAVTLTVMAPHGLWLLLALAPYAVGYLSYRGAVELAHDYGTSTAVLVDLSRFEMYRRMGLKQPESTQKERDTNATLNQIFEFKTGRTLPYDETLNQPQPAQQIEISLKQAED